MSDGAEPASKPRPAEILVDRLADPKTLLALTGLALYAVMRVAYGTFYGPFGLSPDDLGLGYLELLAQSALGAVVLVAVFALSTATMMGYVVLVDDQRAVVIGFIAVIMVLVVIGLLVLRPLFVVAFTICVVVFSAVGFVRVGRALAGTDDPDDGPLFGWRKTLIGVTVTIPLLAAVTLISAAHEASRSIRDGRATQSAFGGIRLTSWGAEAATLSWTSGNIDPALAPLARTCVMFLGQSDGMVFVYVPHALDRATFRVPAALATVRIVPRARCRPGARAPAR